jgi:hypothetical protein
MIFALLEFATIAGIIWFAITQIVVPSMTKRPWFPMFKPETKLKETLAGLEQETYEATLADEVEAKQENLNNMKAKGKKNG